jgi:AcrR family transcriptional regulator
LKQPDTKQKILSTALDLFSRHGYAGASIRQISRVVGIRESAVYNHYKSKEQIFLAILAHFKSKSISKEILSDDLLDQLSEPDNFLKNFTLRLLDLWNKPDERKFIRLLLMEQFTKIGSKELSVSDYLNELRSICRMVFTEMMNSGIIKKFDPDTIADEFVIPLFFLRTERMNRDDEKNIAVIKQIAIRHVEFFWEAVRSH